jgi:exosortase H (IPTLxxWG-CTERM-specific)
MALFLVVFWRWGGFVQGFSQDWTARATAWSLRRLGLEALAQGNLVVSELQPIRIIFECTAVFPAGIFAAAVLAFPTRWLWKLFGLSAGLAALVVINQVRLVSLVYIGHSFPDAFEFSHHVVWQSLIIFFTLVVWLLWASRAGGSRGAEQP